MKLLHVVHTPRLSGAEMLVLSLTRLHCEMGHHSMVVALCPPEKDFIEKIEEQRKIGVEWICPPVVLSRAGRMKAIKRASDAFHPDCTFAHSVLPAAYARLCGAHNVVSVLHDASEYDYKGLYLRTIERVLQYKSKGVIAVSPRAAEKYKRHFKFPKVSCIPNGIDISRYAEIPYEFSASKLKAQLALPEDALVALQVGRISAAKQQFLSVRAISGLVKKDPRVHLLLAGILEDQVCVDEIRRMVEAEGISDNVRLLGPRSDIPELLFLAEVYLMPSKREAHSVAMIEALASGVSIIASKIEAFSFAKVYKGVELVEPEDTDEFQKSISNFFGNPTRNYRDMAQLDIRETARRYIDVVSADFCQK